MFIRRIMAKVVVFEIIETYWNVNLLYMVDDKEKW